jgi:hypothetical protein
MIDATHEGPAMSEAETARAAKKHHEFKYPDGVLINFLFKSTMGANAELAPYLAFKGIHEMNSYVDIIGKFIPIGTLWDCVNRHS